MPGRSAFADSRVAGPHPAPARPPCVNARTLAFFAALAVAFVILSTLPAQALAGDPVGVPLMDQLPNGRRIGYWIPVGVAGSAPVPLLLDTGSKGLMIMASRLGNAPVTRTGRRMKQTFLDGTTFEGEIVRARVTLGKSAATPEPVFILAVKKAACARQNPDCPARMFGEKGPAGILGVGLGNVSNLDNPLEFLHPELSNGFIVQGRGPAGPAQLTLGLTPANRAGFTLFPMPRSKMTLSWRESFFASNSLPACVTLEGAGEALGEGSGAPPVCGKFLLDSGSSASIIFMPDAKQEGSVHVAQATPMSAGKRVTVSFEGMTALTLTSATTPWGDTFRLTRGSKAHNILGAGFFSLFDVLYDLKGSAIGLRPAR